MRTVETKTFISSPSFMREEDEPRFKLWQASMIAVVVLALLLLLVDRSRAFDVSLSPEELAELRAIQAEKERDLVFRFIEAPTEERKEDDAKYMSDADRVIQSAELPEQEVDNEDPVSLGDSIELENQQPAPMLPNEVAQTAQAETKPQQAEPEPESDEPQPLEENPDPVFQLVDGPKPYRPLTEKEVEQSKKAAESRIEREASRPSVASVPGRRYDNPTGRQAPNVGFNIDTSGHDLGPYLKKLVELVKSNWRIPEIARLEASGVVVVYFELHQDGMVKATSVIQNSDFEPLDASSYNAIRNVYQAPPLPDHIEEPWIPIKFSFYYNVRPPR